MINCKLLELLNILYVEDCALAQNSIKPFLTKFFKNVFFFSTGKEAFDFFQKQSRNGVKIDILMTGIGIPILNGFELISKIKAFDITIKTIITSSRIDQESFLKALKFKIDYYAIEPIDIGLLLNGIEDIFLNKQNIVLSQLDYLSAMNKITFFSKIDKYGKISYINNSFIQNSKYSKSELLQQNYDFMYDNSVSKEIRNDLWETINSGKIWKGIIKCISKTKEVNFTSTYIFPIFDNIDKCTIIEFTIIGFQATDRETEKRVFKRNVFLKMKENNKRNYDLKKINKKLKFDLLKTDLRIDLLKKDLDSLDEKLYEKENELLTCENIGTFYNKRVINLFKKKNLLQQNRYAKQMKNKDEKIIYLEDQIEQLEQLNKNLHTNMSESIFDIRRFFPLRGV